MRAPSIGERIAEALRDACHPRVPLDTSVCPMALGALSWMVEVPSLLGVPAFPVSTVVTTDVDRLLV
ncbi:MAG TPA: hypothetical protein VFK43_11140, partial [Acidimicrobiales bacterium]|nr:hypothetical protein [Acidimicrobiales bacterium]